MAIDSPDDRKLGESSRDAHRAAAEAVKSPTFIRAAAQAHGVAPPKVADEPPPAPEDDDAPVDEPEETVETTAAEDDVEETLADDNDEEDYVEDPPEAPSEPSPKAAAAPTPTPPAEKAPVVEPTPAPVPEESQEEMVRRLMGEREDVKEVVSHLGTSRTSIIEKDKELTDLRASRDADKAKHTKLSHQVEYLEERFKADPENFELQQEIQKHKDLLQRLEMAHDAKDVSVMRKETELERLQGSYRNSLGRLQGIIGEETSSRTEQARAKAKHAADTEATEKAWHSTLHPLFDKYGIPKDASLRNEIEQDLLDHALSHVKIRGDIADVPAWLEDRVKREAGKGRRIADAATKTYVDLKRKDAVQPAPTGKAAAAPPKKQGRYDSKTADREARAALRAAMSR